MVVSLLTLFHALRLVVEVHCSNTSSVFFAFPGFVMLVLFLKKKIENEMKAIYHTFTYSKL